MPHEPLISFEIQKYHQNEPKFNVFYSRDNISHKVKHGEYVVNLDEHVNIGTHLTALCFKS